MKPTIFLGQYIDTNPKGLTNRKLALPEKGIIRGRGFENDAFPTKSYDVLKMLTDQNYTYKLYSEK